MFKIVLIDESGNVDSYAAGDPTPGRGANEFATEEEALAAIAALEDGPDGMNPKPGERWAVRPQ